MLKYGADLADLSGDRGVPGSRPASQLGGRRLRYVTVTPGEATPMASNELVKGADQTAPIVLAATVENVE